MIPWVLVEATGWALLFTGLGLMIYGHGAFWWGLGLLGAGYALRWRAAQ